MTTNIIIPGSFGSQLWDAPKPGFWSKIWINPVGLIFGKFKLLDMNNGSKTIQANGFIESIYEELENNIPSMVDFPYDWRKDISESSDLLVNMITLKLKGTVNLITHSMGGMIARLAIQTLNSNGFDMSRIGKLIMIAPANQGCIAAVLGLAGMTKDLPEFNVLPNPGSATQKILATFTSLYQTIPWNEDIFVYLKNSDYRQYAWWNGLAEQSQTGQIGFGAKIDTSFFNDKTTIIYGTGISTPLGASWVNGKIEPTSMTLNGDGFVPEISSMETGIKCYGFKLGHLDLPRSQKVIALINSFLS
jgi:hypothetical protein